jgi:response regulator RpfG family c-di-GMP phosphodiesterase
VKEFDPISIDQIPTSADGNTLVDIYVYFTHSKKFVKFLSIGDPLNLQRLETIKTHSDPNLYVKAGSLQSAEVLKADPQKLHSMKQVVSQLDTHERIQDLNKKIREELKEIVFFLKADPSVVQADAQMTLVKMESLAEEILGMVAPDVGDLRKFLIGNLKYVMLMEDAAALTSIAVTTAVAHRFDSRAIFRDVALATTLMDSPLADLSEDELKQYYLDPSKLDKKSSDLVRQHPIIASQAFSIRIKSFSPTVIQLILGHHELFNGRGYPKGTRSELLPAVVRSFSLAVDLFEHMKRAKYQGRDLDLKTAAIQLVEKDVPTHLRRHNQKLMSTLISFLEDPRR